MAIILDGKSYGDKICEELKQSVQKLSKKPKLAVILAGENPASQIYVKNKQKKAEYIGFESNVIKLPSNMSEEKIIENIHQLNNDKETNSILVQLPLPNGINQERIIEAIDPKKDCDGFTSYNFGRLALGYGPYAIPCTPKGIMKLLEYYKIEIQSKNAIVIGRSNIVGKPISLLLQQKNATVVMAHSHTQNLKDLAKNADIIISAIGKSEFITSDYIKKGAVIVDVGINRTDTGLKGDIKFDECAIKASYITPVPGGIGPMTIAMLMQNTFELYNIQK